MDDKNDIEEILQLMSMQLCEEHGGPILFNLTEQEKHALDKHIGILMHRAYMLGKKEATK